MPAFSLEPAPRRFTRRFTADRRSPTTPAYAEVRGFGSELEPRYIVRAGSLDQ